eukprot:829599-Pelagomonas_calceolata.AAC.3
MLPASRTERTAHALAFLRSLHQTLPHSAVTSLSQSPNYGPLNKGPSEPELTELAVMCTWTSSPGCRAQPCARVAPHTPMRQAACHRACAAWGIPRPCTPLVRQTHTAAMQGPACVPGCTHESNRIRGL